jgi:uncharacterized membrane protein YfhO
MEVRTKADGPAFLVTSDIFYPGWRATVDGAPARLYQTDYVLRGVALPGGEHVVRFEFSPHSFYYGLGLSALSLFMLGGWVLWPFRVRRSSKGQGLDKRHSLESAITALPPSLP